MHLFYWDRLDDLIQIERLLRQGSIIAGETDTVLGLFANCSKEGRLTLDAIKKRSNKPYICLVSNEEKAKKLIHSSEHAMLCRLASIIWPGPVTVIFKVSEEYLYASSEKAVAIRIPNDPMIVSLLERFNALFSTSANISGEPVPKDLDDIRKEIIQKIAGFVQHEIPQKHIAPSVILKPEENKITIVRGTLSQSIQGTLLKRGFSWVNHNLDRTSILDINFPLQVKRIKIDQNYKGFDFIKE